MVRAAGAAEVHLRISCPPTVSPCFYGVDTPRRAELIAATHTLEEIRKYVAADTIGYLSLGGLLSSVKAKSASYCTSCYTGNYPVAFPRDESAYLQLVAEDRRQARAVARGRTRNRGLGHSRRDGQKILFGALVLAWAITAGLAVPSVALDLQERGPTPASPEQIRAAIDKLADFDYPTRMAAGRTIRRAPAAQAVPALLQAVSEHADGFIRFKALTLLTGFNDPRTADAMDDRDGLAERSPARSRVCVFRAPPAPRARAANAGRARQGRRRVRSPRAGSRAGRDAEGTQGHRGADPRRRPRPRFLPQHGDRGDRRLQDRGGDSAAHRDRQARRTAAG